MGISKTPNVDYRGKPRKDFVMKTTATLASLDLIYAEEALVDHLRNTGFTEDEIYCCICEDREYREKDLVEDETSDWFDNRY